MHQLASITTGLSVLLVSAGAAAAPVVTVTAPGAGAGVGDQVSIGATVTSPFVISSVHAQVLTAGVDLTNAAPTFYGTLDISALPLGPATLIVTATDATSAVTAVQVAVVHDHAPTISVATIDGTVARPLIRLQATCADTDAYGCAQLAVKVAASTIATSSGASLDQTVSLAAYEGQAITIDFVATDTAGLSTARSILAHVDSSPALVEVAHGDGPILDFDATRILYRGGGSLVVRPRAGGADTTVASVAPAKAFLTPLGAIWPGGEWRNGTPLTNTADASLVSRGGFAFWNDGSYRNTVLDTTSFIDISAFRYVETADVAANGDVALSVVPSSNLQEKVFRYRSGSLTPISANANNNRDVVTDGINIAYARETQSGHWEGTYVNDTLVSLGAPIASVGSCAEIQFRVQGGWTAFTDTAPNGQNVCSSGDTTFLYTRSPVAVITLASPFNGVTTLDSVADDGSVMYFVNGTRYLGTVASAPTTVIATNDLGRGVYSNGQWYVVIGASLFAVNAGTSGADGGAPDAGPADAGSNDAGPADAESDATVNDAGTEAGAALDASAPDMDASAVSPDDASSGNTAPDTSTPSAAPMDRGGCTASSSRAGDAGFVALTLLAWALRRRRRDAGARERA